MYVKGYHTSANQKVFCWSFPSTMQSMDGLFMIIWKPVCYWDSIGAMIILEHAPSSFQTTIQWAMGASISSYDPNMSFE